MHFWARVANSRVIWVLAIVVIAGALVTGFTTWNIGRRVSEGLIEEHTNQAFYELLAPIPAGSPGDIVRLERIESAPLGTKAWRVLYHSTDVHGENILVSGVIVAPEKAAPEGGRTIVSWGHPTTGSAQRCAPSVGIDPFDLIEGLHDFIARDYVVVATDYSGMGAAGPSAYLIGVTEGNNMLDAARAARLIPETGAGDHLVLWGHSQGGQAALFAGQLAPTYAPELNLIGVAVAAPATDLGELLQSDIGDVSGVSIASYAFAAYNTVYASTPGMSLESILTPAGIAQTSEMASLCLFGQNKELHAIATPLVGDYLIGEPSKVEPWATLLNQNTPGATRLDVPLFIAQGQIDTLVHPEITAQFAKHEQSLGTAVTFVPIPDTGHALVALKALPHLFEWLKEISGEE
jgi:pimeloyl-ACP methyl ester carboxylesterase